MKALPLEQEQLLRLQELDLSIGRLRHQQATHPALEKLQAMRGRKEDLRRAVVATDAQIAELGRQMKQVQDEAAKVRARRDLQEKRLNDGKVPLRDMSAMEHEIASMGRRIDELETSELDLLERQEKLTNAVQAAQATSAAIGDDCARTEADMSADLAKSNAELASLAVSRTSLREKLPADLLARYDQLQSRLGQLVVIEVRDGTPLRSPVQFSVSELDLLRAAPRDQLFASDDHEYWLVRTSQDKGW